MTQTQSLALQLKESSKSRKKKRTYTIVILFAVLIVLSYLMLTVGNTHYSIGEVFSIAMSGSTKGAGYTINKLRIPKLIVGGLAGFAFGISGYTFQTLLRNSLASPDIIGITAGSSTAAVFCILILGISGMVVSVFSVAAGLLTTLFIFFLSGKFSSSAGNRMILVGIGVQAIMNSLISWMLLIGSEFDVATALRWLRGSLSNIQQRDILPITVIVAVSCAGLFLIKNSVYMMQMGDEYPVTLGVRTEETRVLAMVFALMLSAGATAVTGPIASVAFLSGPIRTKLVGKSEDAMLPAGLVGTIIVFAAELIGQNLFSTRYPVGVITGILGAPYLLILLTRINRKGEQS